MSYKTSIVFNSKGRYELLKLCLNSIHNSQILCYVDNDDVETKDIMSQYNVFYLEGPKPDSLSQSLNQLLPYVKGKYVWVIGNDVEIITPNYNELIEETIENFLIDKPDRICYLHIEDDLLPEHFQNQYGACAFPIVTKEFCDALGWILPPVLGGWGADFAMKKIFDGIGRIVVNKKIKIKHYCHHNRRVEQDQINMGVRDRSNDMDTNTLNEYINILRSKI